MLDSMIAPSRATDTDTNHHFRNGCCSARHPCLVHREIAERYRRKRKPFVFDELRVEEIKRLARKRYGPTLPDDEDGRAFAFVMAHHLIEPERIRLWLDAAPWLDEDDAEKLIRKVSANRYRFGADKIASVRWLKVSDAERQALKLRTIGAFDLPKTERQKRRRERYRPRRQALDRVRKARQRRANNKPTREAWLAANSATRMRPWEAFGICRRTWERRGKPPPEMAVAGCSATYTVSTRGRTTCDTPREPLRPKRRKRSRPEIKARRKRQRRRAVRAGDRLSASASPRRSRQPHGKSTSTGGSSITVPNDTRNAVAAARRLATAAMLALPTQ